MTKLTDTQAILLSTAANRDGGSVLPPPETLGPISDRIRKAMATLIKRDLAEEVTVAKTNASWRREDDRLFGAVITSAGLLAIGVEPEKSSEDHSAPALAQPPVAIAGPTKTSMVLGLLEREQGATLAELVAATRWLPHKTRAALTGLRKKGYVLNKSTRDGATCYQIVAA